MTDRAEPKAEDAPLSPSASLLVKLGSIAVHADELLTLTPAAMRGHEHDKIAIQQLLRDQEVMQWVEEMHKNAMLPVKR